MTVIRQTYTVFEGEPEDLSVKYEITGDLLGQGGMCEVYAGSERSTGTALAFKALKPALSVRTDLRHRHRQEIHILRSIRHPHILRFHDAGSHRGYETLVTERCMTSLFKRHQPSPASVSQVLKYAQGILDALEVIHEAGVLHRDIKPSNILVGFDDQVRLADFGISTLSGEAVEDTRRLGTAKYTAPDLREDPSRAVPEHDLFALGLTMYALATHKPTLALAESRGSMRAMLLRGFSPAVETLLHRATHPDRYRRYETAAEMRVDLLACI